MSSTYNNIYDTGSNDKVVNKNGEETSFIYGDLQERVQVVNAKSINSNTAYVSVSENNAVRVDVRRVPNKFTVVDANDGKVSSFDGSTPIQIIVPSIITNIAYGISPANNVPYLGAVAGEHYIDFTYGSAAGYFEHVYVSLKPLQNLIKAEEQARIEADNVLDGKISDEVSRATLAEQTIQQTLQRNIDAEVLRAQGAESALGGRITDEVSRAQGVEGGLQTSINTINSKIPNQASSENQLADKEFVNSSIQNMAAFYVTYDAQGNPFPTKASLTSSTQVYIDGELRPYIGRNDYCVILADESKHTVSGDPTTRYIYQGELSEPYDASKWAFQYIINNTGLTAEQLAAINSGITSELVQQFSGYEQGKQDTLVSGENIKTINNTSLLGSGNIDVQEPLVSGTNIKTINGSSILGAGDIEITGVTDYDELTDKPIINQDLMDKDFVPEENVSYRHTGEKFSQSYGKFKLNTPLTSIYFDIDKSVDTMYDILEDMTSKASPIVSDGGISLYYFLVVGEDVQHLDYLPIIYAADPSIDAQDSIKFFGEVITRTEYILFSDSHDSGIIFTTHDLPENSELSELGADAGWQTDSIHFDPIPILANTYASYLEKFAGTDTTLIEPERIYINKNNKYVIGDYDEIVNTPITNADLYNEDFVPEDGNYYRQVGESVKSSKEFVDGEFYNVAYLSRPGASETEAMFDYLDSNVDPDYVGMTLNGSSITVNYPYVQAFERAGAELEVGEDGKPVKMWELVHIQQHATTPHRDKAHWDKITVSSWDSTQTYSQGDVVTKLVSVIGQEPVELLEKLPANSKIHFDTSKENELLTYLQSLTYTSYQAEVITDAPGNGLWASSDGNDFILAYINQTSSSQVPIYSTGTFEGNAGNTYPRGWYNLDANGDFTLPYDLYVNSINDPNQQFNGEVITVETTIQETKYYESLLDDNLNQDPETQTSYWQEVSIPDWDNTSSYTVGDLVMSSGVYKCILDFTYSPDSLPVVLYDEYPSLMCTQVEGGRTILYTLILPIWSNKATRFGNLQIMPYAWAGQPGGIFYGDIEDSLPLTSWENSTRKVKLYFRHQDAWKFAFSPLPFESAELGTIYKKESDGYKRILTESDKELPEITKNGQVLTSSCVEYTLKFTQDGSIYKYVAPNGNRFFAFNTTLDSTELRQSLANLFDSINDDLWHISINTTDTSALSDICFYRDTTSQDSDGFDAFLIAGKIYSTSDYVALYSNYAQTYTIEGSEVVVDTTGWFILLNEYAYQANFEISYEAPSMVLDPSVYGRLITVDISTDFLHPYQLFYGDVVDSQPIWKDISIPEGEGLPDYSEASNLDVLRVNVTSAETAFVPPITVGDTISSLYVKYEDMPSYFGDFDTNDTINDLPSTRVVRLNVTGTYNGTANITKYVSLHLIQYGAVSQVFLYYQDTLSSSLEQLSMLYAYYPPYQTGWTKRTVVETGEFYEILSKSLTDIGYRDYTITVESIFEQKKWQSWLGCSTTVEEVSPITPTIEWGSALPDITKSGQVLQSSCETYSFDFVRNSSEDYRCQVESSGKLYFNTDLKENNVIQIVSVLARAVSSSTPQFILQAVSSSSQRLNPYWCFVAGDNSTYAIIAVDQSTSTYYYPLWANFDGELVINGTQIPGVTFSKGWNNTNLEAYTSWTGASYLQYTSPDTVLPTAIYGTLISLQEGLFYGEVKNAKAEWKDLDIASTLSEVTVDYNNLSDYNSSSSTPYRMLGITGSAATQVSTWGPDSMKEWLGANNESGTFTVSSSSWYYNADEYYTELNISNLTASDTLIVVPRTRSDAKKAQEINIYYAFSSGATLYMYCTGQPTTDIAFNYTIIR